MGEARRRSNKTFDGGPPSDRPVPLRVDIFDPLQALRERPRDDARLAVMHDAYQRMHQRPAAMCGACNYEFGWGEPPPVLFCIRPEFPRGDEFPIVGGAICASCADLPSDELCVGLLHHLRAVMPSATVISMGTA